MDDNIELSNNDCRIFIKEIIKSLKSIKYIQQSKYPKDSEFYDIYIQTLKKYDLEDSYKSHILSPLYKLAKYDKVVSYKKENYFVKLDQLLKYLSIHKKILEEYHNNCLDNSTLHTTHTNHKKFIKSEINEKEKFKTNFEKMFIGDNINQDKTYNSIVKTSNILNAYKNNPLFTSLYIQASKDDKYNYMTHERKTELQKINERIFSYKLKLSKRDIVKSFQSYAIDIYHEKSVQNQLMKDCKAIDDKLLVKLIGDISKELLDISVGKPNVKNIDCEFQYLDIINDTPILKPTIKNKAKRLYIKSYEDLLLKFS